MKHFYSLAMAVSAMSLGTLAAVGCASATAEERPEDAERPVAVSQASAAKHDCKGGKEAGHQCKMGGKDGHQCKMDGNGGKAQPGHQCKMGGNGGKAQPGHQCKMDGDKKAAAPAAPAAK